MFRCRETENMAVIACRHVVQGVRPILRVTHDKDGMWQFLCGDVHEEADARVIALGEAAALDKGVRRIAWLPKGCCAQRQSQRGLWLVKRNR